MAAAADNDLRHRTESFHKHPRAVQFQKPGGCAFLQTGKAALQYAAAVGLPHRAPAAQQHPAAGLRSIQHRRKGTVSGDLPFLQGINQCAHKMFSCSSLLHLRHRVVSRRVQ